MLPSDRTPPADTSASPGRPATRLPEEGLLAGVASGLGRRLAIEPNLIRLVFVLLSVLGGAGFLLYLGAWILMPSPDRRGGIGERSPWWLVTGGGLLAVAVVLALSMIADPQPIGLLILAPLFAGIALLNLRPDDHDSPWAPPATPTTTGAGPDPTPGPVGPVAAGPVPPTPAPDQPPPPVPAPPAPTPFGAGTDSSTGSGSDSGQDPTIEQPMEPTWLTVPPDPTTRVPDPANDPTTPIPDPEHDPTTPIPDPARLLDTTEFRPDPTEVLPTSTPIPSPDPDPDGEAGPPGRRGHWAVPRTEAETAAGAGPGTTPTPGTAPGATPAVVGRGGPPLAALSLAAISLLVGASLVIANVAGSDVSPVTVAGLATLIVGVALTVAAYRGRALTLIPLVVLSGIGLVMAPAFDVGLGGGFGSSRVTVESADDLADRYGLGFGGLRLDLRSVRPEEDTVVVAEVGTGVLEIIVADDVPVVVQATSTVGVVSVPGRSTGGLDTSLTFPDDTPDGRLIIDARATLGTVDVRRVSGGR